MLAGLALLAVLGGTPLRAQVDTGGVPPQSGAPPASCTPVLGAPNSWDQLGEPVAVLGATGPQGWDYRTVVDPWRPCLAYRVAGDGRELQRSTDGAKTWQRVFFDGRSTPTGASMHITRVVVPAPGSVYVAEDRSGVAVVRSRDAGNTWEPANSGLEDKPVRRLWFAPDDPNVAYAATQSGGTGEFGFGSQVALYATRDGGSTWRALAGAQFVNGSRYSVAVDPADAAHVYLAISGAGAVGGGNRPAPGSLLLESRDYGASFAPPVRLDGELTEFLAARRPSGSLRLYWLTNTLPPGIRFSDNGGTAWQEVHVDAPINWFGGLVDPVEQDRVLYFGTPDFEGQTDLMALYTRNGFEGKDQEYGEQPPLKTRRYKAGHYGQTYVDRFGQYYVDVGIECRTVRCEPGGEPVAGDYQWLSWRTYRFRPPNPGQAFVLNDTPGESDAEGGSFERFTSCTVEAKSPAYPRSSNADDAGSIAFDGGRLYYTRRAETGPDRSSAVIRMVDPETCTETGRLVVRFDPAVYSQARRRALSDNPGRRPMLPERPSIDSVSYDAVNDELWFSVTRVADAQPPFSGERTTAPFPLWSVPRGGDGGERTASLRLWTQPCGYGGVGLLAHDRVRDSLWTCSGKIPGELDKKGKASTVCLHPLFQGSVAGGESPWIVKGWGLSTPQTLLVVRDDSAGIPPRRIEQFDARTCVHKDTWTPGLDTLLPEPRQGNPEFVSMQLACDPLTFRGQVDGRPAPPAVVWMRSGERFAAFRAPRLACASPTALAYTGERRVAAGRPFDVCATATVPGPSAPIRRLPVRLEVAGVPIGEAVTDAAGRACAAYAVAPGTPDGTRLAVGAGVLGDAHVLASSATATVVVGVDPIPPPAVLAAPPAQPPAPPGVVAVPLPPPPPQPAPQVGAQAPAAPPAQAVSQQGIASEREREVQLAHAQQESTQDADAEALAPASADNEDLAFSAAVVGVLAASVVGLGLAAGRAPAPSMATEPALIGRTRSRPGRPVRRRRR